MKQIFDICEKYLNQVIVKTVITLHFLSVDSVAKLFRSIYFVTFKLKMYFVLNSPMGYVNSANG